MLNKNIQEKSIFLKYYSVHLSQEIILNTFFSEIQLESISIRKPWLLIQELQVFHT